MNARHIGKSYYWVRNPPRGMSYTEAKLALEVALDRAAALLADDACQYPRRGPIVGNAGTLTVVLTQPNCMPVVTAGGEHERKVMAYGRLVGTFMGADVVESDDVPNHVIRLYAERPVEGLVMTELYLVTEHEAHALRPADAAPPRSGEFSPLLLAGLGV